MSKTPSTATNLRKRRSALNHIRKQITIQYHALSGVSCDDRISGRHGTGEPPNELSKGIELLSDAINCLNRELVLSFDFYNLGNRLFEARNH